MKAQVFGGPYSGNTFHLPERTRAIAVAARGKTVIGEYREYEEGRFIWFDPADIEEAKRPASKDERHQAQDLLRALRASRLAATEAAREEGARKAAIIQARWEASMSDTMRERLAEVREQARREAESGARFAHTDEELWEDA